MDKKPLVIGVTGGSGSGKTLFINELLRQVPDVALLSMDNYYIARAHQPKDEKGVENFDTLDSIDQKKFVSDLNKLISGSSIQLTEYTYNNASATPKMIKVHPCPVILVEGIFTLHLKEIRERLDVKIFIDAPDFLMLKRRILRDAEERGYDLADVLYRFEHHVMPSYDTYIRPTKKYADLVIPNHTGFDQALQVLKTFLNQ